MTKHLILLLLLACPLGAHAASITILTDTATDLSGTFSFQGSIVTEEVSATDFGELLPGYSDNLFGGRGSVTSFF